MGVFGVWCNLGFSNNFSLSATPRVVVPPPFSVGKAKKVCEALKDDGRSEIMFKVSSNLNEQLSTAKKQGDKSKVNICEWCRNFFKAFSVACKTNKKNIALKVDPNEKNTTPSSTPERSVNLSPTGANAPSLTTVHVLSELFTELEISTRPYRSGVEPARVKENDFNQDETTEITDSNDTESSYQSSRSMLDDSDSDVAQVVSDVGAQTVLMLYTALKRASGFSPAEQEYFRILNQYLFSPFKARISFLGKQRVVTNDAVNKKGAESLFE